MNILITSAGRRVSLVRAFQKELKTLIPEGKVFTADLNPRYSSACHFGDGCFEVPGATDPEYIRALISLSIENNIRLIVPTIDPELLPLSLAKKRFKEYGINCIVSDAEIIRRLIDKRKTHEFFEEHGFNYAKEYKRGEELFPLFIKPVGGSNSKDVCLVKRKEDLTPAMINDQNLMFLEYLDPKEHKEFTVDLYFDRNSKLKCIVPRERIEIRNGEIYKGITAKNDLINYIRKRFKSVTGFNGCITLQLFQNNKTGNVYGIEINPRFGGGYPLTYKSGANYPRWLIDEYIFGKSIPFFHGWEDNLLMLRYDEEVLVNGFSHK